MKTVSILLLAILLPATFASAQELTTARVISIKNYDRGRIAYWEGNVPVYDDYPVYDISISVGQKMYVVRYESLTGYYPRAWNVGNEIQVKQQRGQFVLMNGEEEIPARTVSKYDCNPSSTRPTGWTSTTRLPCH